MNRLKKIGAGGMIVLSLLFLFPQKTQAQYVDVANTLKEYGLDTLGWFIVNLVINKMTAATVNWINSGFEGNPAFVTDPEQFFLDVGDNTASDILSRTALNRLCAPFKAEVRLALVKNYINNDQNYSCTLSKVKDNYEEFTRDFSKGGWEGWFEITQNDENNPYGAYLNAKTELEESVDKQVQKYNEQLNRAGGFLSYEKCTAAGTVTQKMIDDNNDLIRRGLLSPGNNALSGKKVGDCVGKKEVVTPGSVIEEKLNKALGAGEGKLQVADEIGELISALLNQLANKLTQGLKGLSDKKQGQKSFTELLAEDEPPLASIPPITTNPTVTCQNTSTGMVCTTPPITPGQVCTTGPSSIDPTTGATIPGKEYCTIVPVSIGGGGGGQCLDDGVYAGALKGAMDAVLASNPSLANSPNTDANGFAFIKLVAENPPAGFNVTDKVLNGNDNPNRGDLLAIWRIGDSKMERYDVISASGAGNASISASAQTTFVGRIALNCTESGGGRSCKCEAPPPPPAPPPPGPPTPPGPNPPPPGPPPPPTPPDANYSTNPFIISLPPSLTQDIPGVGLGNGAGGVFAHDLNGDALMDFVITNLNVIATYDHSGTQLWLKNDDIWLSTYGAPGLRSSYPGYHNPGIIAGDIDGDGQQELAYLTFGGLLKIINARTGALEKSYQSGNAVGIAIANFRGVGDRDAILLYNISEIRAINLETGATLWRKTDWNELDDTQTRVADINGDGRDEVLGPYILNSSGNKINTWDLPRDLGTDLRGLDSLAVGDVVPGGPLELVIAEQGGNNEIIALNQNGILWNTFRDDVPTTGECRRIPDPDKLAVGNFDTSRPGLETFARSSCGRHPWVLDSSGNIISKWNVSQTAPQGWYLGNDGGGRSLVDGDFSTEDEGGIDDVQAINWFGDNRHVLAVIQRQNPGPAALVNAMTGNFIQVFPGTALRLYTANVAGDSRDEFITINQSPPSLKIYWNSQPSASVQPNPWLNQLYRRFKQNFSHYSPPGISSGTSSGTN